MLTFFGGRVCPYLAALSYWHIFSILIIPFTLILLLRYFLEKSFVDDAPLSGQVMRQFYMELSLFLAAGLAVIFFNTFYYKFPLLCGFKFLVGVLAFGFFLAVDLSLKRERFLHRTIAESQIEMVIDKKYLAITTKMALTATGTIILAGSVIILVVNKELDTLFLLENGRHAYIKHLILLDILGISAILLIQFTNLIQSFTKNLKQFLWSQNKTLKEVARGKLETRVPVSRNDELGMMAQYTNLMIHKLTERTIEVERTQDATILALSSLAETRDSETGSHILRTQNYIRILANYLKNKPKYKAILTDKTISLISKSAALHDIGKVGVSDAILLKKGKLTPLEWKEMQMHPQYGHHALQQAINALGANAFLLTAQEIAYTHHEKWDGTGYPQGLKGEEIPISSRLMAVADVYDALISHRIYKPPYHHDDAKQEILAGRGTHFDPEIVNAFLATEDEFKYIAKQYADELRVVS